MSYETILHAYFLYLSLQVLYAEGVQKIHLNILHPVRFKTAEFYSRVS